jgi:putative transposase
MKTRVQAHVAYKLLYHVVWIPKYRYQLTKGGVGAYCHKVVLGIVANHYEDVIVEELNIQGDHVHLLISIPPKYAISSIIGTIKRLSSKLMRQKFEYLRRGRNSMWSIGYFVSSVGLNETIIRNYISYQQDQDSGQLLAVWDNEATGKAKRHP